jgi:hypothetical protein
MARNGQFPHRLAGVEGLQEAFIFNARFVYPSQIRRESPHSGAGELSNLFAARIEARQGQDRATGLGSREPEMPAQPLFRNPSW